MNDIISVASLSQRLDCSPKTIRDWLYRQRKTASVDPLPHYRIGGLVRFRWSEVEAWILRRRVRVVGDSKSAVSPAFQPTPTFPKL